MAQTGGTGACTAPWRREPHHQVLPGDTTAHETGAVPREVLQPEHWARLIRGLGQHDCFDVIV